MARKAQQSKPKTQFEINLVTIRAIQAAYKENPADTEIYKDLKDMLENTVKDLKKECLNSKLSESRIYDLYTGELRTLSSYAQRARNSLIEQILKSQENQFSIKADKLYNELLKFEAPILFESYIEYMENDREYSKQFYAPRKKTLKQVVDDLQDLDERKIKFYGLSMPSRTGKSTICIFYLSWHALRFPNSHSAMGGHSGSLAKGFYKELLNIILTPEYKFDELYNYLYPNHTMVCEKSAEDFTINLDMPDRFSTISCRGIDGTWTGAIDVSWDGVLYVDDLVRDREHSLSPTRMENTYQEYLNKMVDRKSGWYPGGLFAGSLELMVGTLWNVYDPLERVRKQYENNPLYRFRRIPALNEHGKSNFDYDFNGFSTEYFLEIKERLDPAEWAAKYMQKPYMREGILMPVDELRYFNGILPDGDHRKVSVVDVALGGGDSLSMPVGAEYPNGDVYIYDWVFNKGTKEITLPLVTGRLISNEIRQTRFEANQGGDLYCSWVDKMLVEQGYKCSCTHRRAPNTLEKKSKIIAYSDDIKRKFVFISPIKPTKEELENDAKYGIKRYLRTNEYDNAFDEMTTFVTIGKNDNDDAMDSIAQLDMFIEGDINERHTRIIQSPI